MGQETKDVNHDVTASQGLRSRHATIALQTVASLVDVTNFLRQSGRYVVALLSEAVMPVIGALLPLLISGLISRVISVLRPLPRDGQMGAVTSVLKAYLTNGQMARAIDAPKGEASIWTDQENVVSAPLPGLFVRTIGVFLMLTETVSRMRRIIVFMCLTLTKVIETTIEEVTHATGVTKM